MERDQEAERRATASGDAQQEKGRTWTRRIAEPVQYRRYSNWGDDGGQFIYFEFALPPGQERLDPAIYAVMKEHQKLKDGHPTGLKSRKAGKVWSMPDHEHNRALADRIDMALKAVAHQLDQEPGRGR